MTPALSDRFAVRLAVDTPLALRGLLHLDGLLMALKADAGGDAHDIPLATTAGVRLGSAALMECGIFGLGHENVSRVKKISDDELPAGIFDHLKPTSLIIRDMSPCRPALGSYPVLSGVRAIWFTATGNKDETAELLSTVRNVGAMTRTGYGRVVEMQIFDVAESPWPTGVALPDGMPARSMDVRTYQAMGLPEHRDTVVSMMRPYPPYWTGRETECVSPIQSRMTGTRSELMQMIGTCAG